MINTQQRIMSARHVGLPWREPSVDMASETNLGETSVHMGTLQTYAHYYGGVMAITYRPGVDADSDNLSLGTLRSDATSAGTQIYFVSLDDVLGVGELANGTPTASSTNAAVTISTVAVNTAALSTNDGTVVAPIGRAIEFRVTLPTATFGNARAPILVHYPTDGSNAGNITVWLEIRWNA